VRGPLNIARPVQGRPVIVQAGASDAGRQLAAETADVVFAPARSIEDGRALYADIHRRMRAIGRTDDKLKILPAALVVVGATQEQAEQATGAYSSRSSGPVSGNLIFV
jgi:alkanesulfonate monooxygenase